VRRQVRGKKRLLPSTIPTCVVGLRKTTTNLTNRYLRNFPHKIRGCSQVYNYARYRSVCSSGIVLVAVHRATISAPTRYSAIPVKLCHIFFSPLYIPLLIYFKRQLVLTVNAAVYTITY